MTDTDVRGDTAITRTTIRGYGREQTFAGVLSFMRRRYTKDLAGADVVVSGIPLDLATTNRPGARLGPAAIRAASVDLNWPIYPWGFGPCDRLSVIDYAEKFGRPLSIIHFDAHSDTWADDDERSLNQDRKSVV